MDFILKNLTFLCLLSFLSCGQTSIKENKNQISQKDTCENPDGSANCCFVNMPENVSSIMNIADTSEPGERMIITGTIFKKDITTPYQNVKIYAYHTDNSGYYSKKGNETGAQKWHGHLHGWCISDANGNFEIHSVRPAPYPGNSDPAHIHAVILEPQNKDASYIADFIFKDDSLVNAEYFSSHNIPFGDGVVDLQKSSDGVWEGHRDIVLK